MQKTIKDPRQTEKKTHNISRRTKIKLSRRDLGKAIKMVAENQDQKPGNYKVNQYDCKRTKKSRNIPLLTGERERERDPGRAGRRRKNHHKSSLTIPSSQLISC